MTALIISILAGWIIFSTFLVLIIFMHSSRLSRGDNQIHDPEQVARQKKDEKRTFRLPDQNVGPVGAKAQDYR